MRRRTWGRAGSIVAAGLLGVLELAVPPGMAGASNPPKPTVTALTATPSTISTVGGSTTITATVANATTCSISSSLALLAGGGLFDCSDGPVSQVIRFTKNATKKTAKYTISLEAVGSGRTKSAKVKLSVGPGDGGPTVPLAPSDVTATAGNASA